MHPLSRLEKKSKKKTRNEKTDDESRIKDINPNHLWDTLKRRIRQRNQPGIEVDIGSIIEILYINIQIL